MSTVVKKDSLCPPNKSRGLNGARKGSAVSSSLSSSLSSFDDKNISGIFMNTDRSVTISTVESRGVPILRRRSTLKSFTQSITGFMQLRRLTLARLSGTEESLQKSKEKIQNTYKVTPDKGKTFNPKVANRIATEIIEEQMKDIKYNPAICGEQACNLAKIIQSAIKELKYPRYKIICQVIIGEVKNQGVEAASRCVWDAKHDNYTCINYTNDSLFVSALIHGVYFE